MGAGEVHGAEVGALSVLAVCDAESLLIDPGRLPENEG